MARLAFGGFDFGHEHADGLTVGGSTWAAPTYDASITRSGAGRSGKVVTTTSGGQRYWELLAGGSVDVDYFFRVWVYFTALPSVNVPIISLQDGTAQSRASFSVNADGTWNGIAGTSATPNTWHCVEARFFAASNTTTGYSEEWRVDGVVVTPFHRIGGLANQKVGRWRFGVAPIISSTVTLSTPWTVYFEDWALNDDTGASDNSYPGITERIALLLPASDNAVGANWKLGAGGTPSGNFFDAINNTPPTGSNTANDTTAVRDTVAPTGVATDQADVNLQSYTSAGVPAGATISQLQLVGEFAPTAATAAAGPTAGISGVSNPAVAEATGIPGTAAPTAYPSGWGRLATAMAAQPTVTPTASPVARIRYVTAAASGGLQCTALGAYVAYVPPIQIVQTTGTGGTANSFSFGLGSAAAGDVVMLLPETPSGFTHPASGTDGWTTQASLNLEGTKITAYTRTVAAGETSWTLTFSSLTNYNYIALLLRGASTSAPVASASSASIASNGAASQTFTPADATITDIKQLGLLAVGARSVLGTANSDITSTPDWTRSAFRRSTAAGGEATFSAAPTATGTLAAPTLTIVSGGTNNTTAVALTMVLAPSGAAPPQTISPLSLGSTEVVRPPTVTPQNQLFPIAIASQAAVGTPVVVGNQAVGVGGIASQEAFGTADVTGPIGATGIPSSQAFGSPLVLSGVVGAGGIASRQALGTPQITGGYHRYDFVTPGSPQGTTNGVTRDFTIFVSGLGSITDVELSLYMTNPGGLSKNAVTLIAPDGTSVALIPNNVPGNRTATGRGTADQDRTQFDGEAAKAWGSGADAPWVGRFRPSGNLAALNGRDPNGTWRLRVVDAKQGNTINTIHVATLLIDAVMPFAPQTISAPSLPVTEALGIPRISGPISPPSIASREAVGQPAIQQTPGNQFAVIFGLAIASAGAIGRPTVTGPVTATSIASTEAVGTPTLDVDAPPQGEIVDAGAIAPDESFGTATVGRRPTVIAPPAIVTATAFGAATVRLVTLPPPAPGQGRPRTASWLRDEATSFTYEWPLNHSFEQPVSVTRSETRGAPRGDVGFARQQRPGEPLLLQLEGVILDPAQLAQLENFYDRCALRPVVFHDADGDEYEVLITGFNARHVAAYNHGRDCYWTYALTLEVLDVRAGAYEEIA